jgi:hypothetical protein
MTSIGGDWTECYDESSGLNYYLNSVTGESTWTRPVIESAAASSTPVWVESWDETSGRYYYYNTITYATVWDRPADFDGISSSSTAAVTETVSAATTEDDAANWVVGVDQSSGREYYYNNITQATQWDKPQCLITIESAASPPPPPEKKDSINIQAPKKISMIPMPGRPAINLGGGRPSLLANTTLKSPLVSPSSAAGSTSPVSGEISTFPKESANTSDTFEDSMSAIKDDQFQNRSSSEYTDMINSRLTESSNVAPPAPGAPKRDSLADFTMTAPAPRNVKISEDGESKTIEASGVPAPPPPKKLSAKQSFEQLRAMEAMSITECPDEDTTEADGDISASAGDLKDVRDDPTDRKKTSVLLYSDDKTTAELIDQVTGITIEQYADKFFNFDRKGIFKSRTTVEKILTWKAELIKTSLRNLPSDMSQEAVQLFRNVMGYMGDRTSSKTPTEHALKILNAMLLSPEELRDEVYCQVVKQTGNNPNPVSATRGWELMMICLSTFPPSSDMMPHLMAYCVSNLTNDVIAVAKYAELCLHRIPKICRLGPRRELPTKMEIEALRRAEHVGIRAYFIDEKYIVARVDSWTTARDFEETISKLIKLQKDSAFSVFEVSTKEEERVLDSEERILDLVAFWQRTLLEEVAKGTDQSTLEEFRFMFKVGLFYDIEETDTAGIELMYIQATHDVVDARYPCSEQDAVTLAALQMQEECGDYPTNEPCNHLRGKLGNYVAARLVEQKPAVELEEAIYKLYEKLKGYTQMEARLSYLDYVKSWKIYGSTYFFAEPQNNKDLPREVILAVNNKAILVVDPGTKEFLAEYDYGNIVTWGHSANSFVVITGSSNRQNKMYFKTDQGKEINNMVKCYVESRMA